MMVVNRILTLLAFSMITASAAWANNLQFSNLDEVSVNTSAKQITFSVNASQDNSWFDTSAGSFDAVWVFMKYSTDGGTTWRHAHMAGMGVNPSGFSIPTQFQDQFEVVVPSDQMGFYLQRTGQGSGSFNMTGLQFVWGYGQEVNPTVSDAMAQAPNTLHTIYGIEMVYIPQGAFHAGDGDVNLTQEYALGGTNPWYIQGETSFSTTPVNGSYFYQSTGATGGTGEFATGSPNTIPLSFPKGYNAFYLMKYELTEGQWVSFFNTLSPAQKQYRDITSNNARTGGKGTSQVVYRNTVAWNSAIPASPATTQRPSRAVSFVSWPDVAAYAEWAGLRPITELEFEKAARGKDQPVTQGEFVWGGGATTITPASPNGISPDSDENGSEQMSDSSNINGIGISGVFTSGDGRNGGVAQNQAGPLRAGIFAASAQSPTRQNTGAGFYGNMELSGNLAQPVVTVGRAESVNNFQGSNGTGLLSIYGFATNGDWPGWDSAASQVDGTLGIGYRGGDFQSPSTTIFMTSARTYAVRDPDTMNCAQRGGVSCGYFTGGRLGRTP